MIEGTGSVPFDAQQAAQIALEQGQRARATLRQIAETGDLAEIGGDVFHWLLLKKDREEDGLSLEREEIYLTLSADLLLRFGEKGREEVGFAIACIAEDRRNAEIASLSGYW